MPASGPSTPLAPNFSLDCIKKLKNTLTGQLLALQLNIRYNTAYNNLNLGNLVLSQSCVLTSSQITGLGLTNTSTVNDLIALSNDFLSSNCNGHTFANGFGGLLTAALTASMSIGIIAR